MLLGDYFNNINNNHKKFFFSDISFNSNQIKKDNIFFAIKGNKIDGNNFILSAIKNGAKIIVTEKKKYGLKNGILFLNVSHGDQLLVEYNKKDIIDKINTFFGYQFVKEIRLVLIREKIEMTRRQDLDKNQISKYHKKIENIENSQLKEKLESLIGAFGKKKI